MGVIIRAAIAYWLLLFALRLLGRRPGTQMTPFELILLFLLGGVTIQGVLGDDCSMTNAVVEARARRQFPRSLWELVVSSRI